MGKQRTDKIRKSSVAWDYFTKEGDRHAKCQICEKLLSFQGGNTTNLTRHVVIKHKLPLKFGQKSLKKSVKSEGDTDQNGGVIILENFNGESFPSEILLQEGDVDAGKKRKNKSPLWRYFTHVEGYKTKCNFCKALISTKGGSTSNLKRHLKKKHKKVVVVPQDKRKEAEDNLKVAGEVIIVQGSSGEPELVFKNFMASENTDIQTNERISPSLACEENPLEQSPSTKELNVFRNPLTSNSLLNEELDNNRDHVMSHNQDLITGQRDNEPYLEDISDGRASYNPSSPISNQHSHEFNKNTEAFKEIAHNLGRLATAFERIADVVSSTYRGKTGSNERNTNSKVGSKLNELITKVLGE